ncbi:MAG: SpoIIE family protein phosphatase [Vicinamibacterales bacterium]
MEVIAGVAVTVTEETQVSEARRRAMSVAATFGFDDTARGRVALVVTEVATNLIKHGGGGEVLVGPAASVARGVQVIGIDKGRGMPSVAESLRDGYSTAGSPGTGLGAIQRASTSFDVYSTPARGTVIAATVYPDSAAPPMAGGVSVPAPGEIECGDGWALWSAGKLTSIFVCDGLGHGAGAAHAARLAIATFRSHAERPAAEVIRRVFDALKATRGAAVAVAALDEREGRIVFCGLGNISGTVIHPDGTAHHMISHGGIAGHTMLRLQELSYAWPPGSLVVLHTDGVATNWTLGRYDGLELRRPDVIAGLLYRDFRRGRDDATVVVARNVAAS